MPRGATYLTTATNSDGLMYILKLPGIRSFKYIKDKTFARIKYVSQWVLFGVAELSIRNPSGTIPMRKSKHNRYY